MELRLLFTVTLTFESCRGNFLLFIIANVENVMASTFNGVTHTGITPGGGGMRRV